MKSFSLFRVVLLSSILYGVAIGKKVKNDDITSVPDTTASISSHLLLIDTGLRVEHSRDVNEADTKCINQLMDLYNDKVALAYSLSDYIDRRHKLTSKLIDSEGLLQAKEIQDGTDNSDNMNDVKRLRIEVHSVNDKITSIRNILHNFDALIDNGDAANPSVDNTCLDFVKRSYQRNEEHDLVIEALREFEVQLELLSVDGSLDSNENISSHVEDARSEIQMIETELLGIKKDILPKLEAKLNVLTGDDERLDDSVAASTNKIEQLQEENKKVNSFISSLQDYISRELKEDNDASDIRNQAKMVSYLKNLNQKQRKALGDGPTVAKIISDNEKALKTEYVNYISHTTTDNGGDISNAFRDLALTIDSGKSENVLVKTVDPATLSTASIIRQIQLRDKKRQKDIASAQAKIETYQEVLAANLDQISSVQAYVETMKDSIEKNNANKNELEPIVKQYRKDLDHLQGSLVRLRPQVIVLLALQDVRLLLKYLNELGPLVGNQIPALTSTENVATFIQLMSYASSLTSEIDDRGDALRLSALDATISRQSDVDGLTGNLILNYCQGEDNLSDDLKSSLAQLESMGKMFLEDIKTSSPFVAAAINDITYSPSSNDSKFLQLGQAAKLLRNNQK